MTPEQIQLQAYRAEVARLATKCDTEGTRQHEARGFRPANGCLPSLSRTARVVTTPDGAVLVDQTEVTSSRFNGPMRMVVVASDIEMGKALADEWCAACSRGQDRVASLPLPSRRRPHGGRRYY